MPPVDAIEYLVVLVGGRINEVFVIEPRVDESLKLRELPVNLLFVEPPLVLLDNLIRV